MLLHPGSTSVHCGDAAFQLGGASLQSAAVPRVVTMSTLQAPFRVRVQIGCVRVGVVLEILVLVLVRRRLRKELPVCQLQQAPPAPIARVVPMRLVAMRVMRVVGMVGVRRVAMRRVRMVRVVAVRRVRMVRVVAVRRVRMVWVVAVRHVRMVRVVAVLRWIGRRR